MYSIRCGLLLRLWWGLSACLSVVHKCELCENGCTDRAAVWDVCLDPSREWALLKTYWDIPRHAAVYVVCKEAARGGAAICYH